MTIYSGPSKEHPYYSSRFIRVGESISVTAPNDERTDHTALARQDGIIEEVSRRRLEDPSSVDAGFVTVVQDEEQYGGHQIMLNADSMTLNIPVVDEARDISVTIFEAQSPGFSVKKL